MSPALRPTVFALVVVALFATWSDGFRRGMAAADRHRTEAAAAERSRRADAIHRTYTADTEVFRAAGNPHPRSSDNLLPALDQYLGDLSAINFSGCPADFRAAYRAHARAWTVYRDAVARLPAGDPTALLPATKANRPGGNGKRAGELATTYQTVHDTWVVVGQVGARYGVSPPM